MPPGTSNAWVESLRQGARHRYETRAAALLRRSPIVCERDRAIWARGYHVGAAKTKIYKDNFQQPVAVRVRLFFSAIHRDSEKAGLLALSSATRSTRYLQQVWQRKNRLEARLEGSINPEKRVYLKVRPSSGVRTSRNMGRKSLAPQADPDFSS
jgi:hypothetical protein